MLILITISHCHTDNSCPQSDDPVELNYGDRQTITSDGYPGNYGDNIHCRWLYTGPPDSVIIVKFDDFQLDLQNDKVIVGRYFTIICMRYY